MKPEDMTDEQLDRFIAEKVMGWEERDELGTQVWVERLHDRAYRRTCSLHDWHPTRVIVQAMDEVAKKMMESGWEFEMEHSFTNHVKCEFVHGSFVRFDASNASGRESRAICEAAAKAVGDE